MKKICLIILFAVLGVTLASCTKETQSDTCVVAAQSATYVVDGRQHYANPQTEEEWAAGAADALQSVATVVLRHVRFGMGHKDLQHHNGDRYERM